MFRKVLLFVVLYCMLLNADCLSQTNQVQPKMDSAILLFNAYLKKSHLNQLIQATDFSYQKEIKFKGKLGEVKRSNVYVLTLEPTKSFTNVIDFASSWKSVLAITEGKVDVYTEQFFALADLTQLPPQSLVIQMKTKSPAIFSYLIELDHQLQVHLQLAEIKGNGKLPEPIDPDLDFPFASSIPIPKEKKVTEKLVNHIKIFMVVGNHGKTEVKKISDDYFQIIGKNLKGRVTGKYYDLIVVYLSINKTSVNYNFKVYFSSEPYQEAKGLKNYEDASKRYYREMVVFNRRLDDVIKTTVK